MTNSKGIDIIIPTYNGLHLLKKNLPFVIKNTNNLGKIIIIDNGSTDGTIDWLNKNISNCVIIKNKQNIGYTIAINQGVRHSNSSYFILLNNDVIPRQGYLDGTLKMFNDQKLFAISFNEEESSWPTIKWENGKINFSRGTDKTKPLYTPWASGGSAIFSRKIWDDLGGLDEIYAPWYWEDIDIGFRAWKSGYFIVWNPKSPVNHKHESTSAKLNQKYVNSIRQRNELIFNWLNINTPKYVFSHLFFLIKHSILHPGYTRIIIMAIVRIIRKQPLPRRNTLTDDQVFMQLSKEYEG